MMVSLQSRSYFVVANNDQEVCQIVDMSMIASYRNERTQKKKKKKTKNRPRSTPGVEEVIYVH